MPSCVRYACLSIFPDDIAGIIADKMSYARVVSITKKEYSFAVHFYKDLKKFLKSILMND